MYWWGKYAEYKKLQFLNIENKIGYIDFKLIWILLVCNSLYRRFIESISVIL